MGKVKRGRGGEGRLASHTTLGPAVTNAKVRSQPPALKKVRGLEPPVPDSDAFGYEPGQIPFLSNNQSCQLKVLKVVNVNAGNSFIHSVIMGRL